jgi:hypothetical protein
MYSLMLSVYNPSARRCWETHSLTEVGAKR